MVNNTGRNRQGIVLKAVIAGAGIGGLTTALALARKGAQVEVLEKTSGFSRVGAGLQLSANAMHILADLGLEDKVFSFASQPDHAAFLDYKTGRPEFITKLGTAHEHRYGQKYLHIHRADLQQILLRAAQSAGVSLKTDAPLTGFRQTTNHVEVQSGTRTTGCDVLIGADGIRSTVRERLLDPEKPRFTGSIAWRGLIDAADLPSDLIPHVVNIWLGPGCHFVCYHVRGGALINFVAVQEREERSQESWIQKGNLCELRSVFANWDERISTVLEACRECHFWGLFDRAPLSGWTDGRICLLGDAAHPMLPFMAQGAAMAIEDAYVLAHALHVAEPDIPTGLKRYETLRKNRTAMLQNISRANMKLYHARSPLARAIRKLKFRAASAIPALAQQRLDKIYGINVTVQTPDLPTRN